MNRIKTEGQNRVPCFLRQISTLKVFGFKTLKSIALKYRQKYIHKLQYLLEFSEKEAPQNPSGSPQTKFTNFVVPLLLLREQVSLQDL